jgi:hypothetical protein
MGHRSARLVSPTSVDLLPLARPARAYAPTIARGAVASGAQRLIDFSARLAIRRHQRGEALCWHRTIRFRGFEKR